MLKGLLLAASFLWRFPVKITKVSEEDFEKALVFFPVVGAFEGLILAISAKILNPYLKEEILAFALLLILFYIRGIFHLDGLSDTFDALAYKGNVNSEEDRKKRLEIMKDSRAGVSGITALFLNLIAKFVFLKILLLKKTFGFVFLPFFFSRVVLLPVIYFSESAKREGLGFLMKKSLTFKGFIRGIILSLLILAGFLIFDSIFKTLHIFLILSLNFLVIFYFQKKFEKAFGGLTGDNYGALVEISEVATLFYGALLW